MRIIRCLPRWEVKHKTSEFRNKTTHKKDEEKVISWFDIFAAVRKKAVIMYREKRSL